MAHSRWLTEILLPKELQTISRILAEKINEDKEKLGINSIAVRGISGLGMGSVVSFLTGLPLIVVRKETKNCHSGIMVEYSNEIVGTPNFCIVDDLIDSGHTVNSIVKEIKSDNKTSSLKKIYLYRDSRNRGEDAFYDNGIEKYPVFAIKPK